MRIHYPHKVLSNAADCGIQLWCHGPDRLCPSFAKRLLEQIELTGQDTFIPQEYRVYLHSCLLPGGLSNRFRPESDVIGIEAEDALGQEVFRVRLAITRGAFVGFPAGSVPAATDWLISPILPSLMARRAAK